MASLPDDDDMAAVQWIVLVLTVVATAVAAYLYNDGHDRALKPMLVAVAVIGAVGTGLFWIGELMTPPASAVPQCDWSDLGDDLSPSCESSSEAARRAAGESGDHFVSSYLIGPTVEFLGVCAGGVIGWLVAKATRRKPTDGREGRILMDDGA